MAGSTQVGGGKAGFYTQEEYKDLVKYAADRFITIVRRLICPATQCSRWHLYPELNCNDTATKLYTGT
jgi:hexosaminidase